MDVSLKPFSLKHIFAATGNNSPPLAVPAKEPYIKVDAPRLARHYNIPLRFREDFMTIIQTKSSINANRLICAVQLAQPDKAESVARALYRRLFVEMGDIFETKDFLEVLTSCGVNSVDDLIAAISSDQVKEMIKRNTEEAQNTGCFGTPWTVVTWKDGRKESFFGADRLPVIEKLMVEAIERSLSSSL